MKPTGQSEEATSNLASIAAAGFVLVDCQERLWNDEMIGVMVGGLKLVLVKLDDEIHAYVDRCAHKGYPLSKGSLKDGVLTCAAHDWQFDARTGQGVNPKSTALRKIPVFEFEGRTYVSIEEV